MRKSNYNILSQKSNLLFNTLTRAMAVLTDEDYHYLYPLLLILPSWMLIHSTSLLKVALSLVMIAMNYPR